MVHTTAMASFIYYAIKGMMSYHVHRIRYYSSIGIPDWKLRGVVNSERRCRTGVPKLARE